MNDLIAIRNWLGNPKATFSDGVTLYDRYKPNNKFDEFFRRNLSNPNSAARSVLIHKLNHVAHLIVSNPLYFEKKLITQSTFHKPVATIKTPSVKATQKPLDQSKLNINELPVNLQKDYRRIQEIAPLIGALHAKLRATKDNVEAKNIVHEISVLDTEKRTLWGGIDKQIGKPDNALDQKIVPKKAEKVDPDAALKKQLQALRDSMNKRKKVRTKQQKDKPHLAKKSTEAINRYQTKITDLERQLANS